MLSFSSLESAGCLYAVNLHVYLHSVPCLPAIYRLMSVFCWVCVCSLLSPVHLSAVMYVCCLFSGCQPVLSAVYMSVCLLSVSLIFAVYLFAVHLCFVGYLYYVCLSAVCLLFICLLSASICCLPANYQQSTVYLFAICCLSTHCRTSFGYISSAVRLIANFPCYLSFPCLRNCMLSVCLLTAV